MNEMISFLVHQETKLSSEVQELKAVTTNKQKQLGKIRRDLEYYRSLENGVIALTSTQERVREAIVALLNRHGEIPTDRIREVLYEELKKRGIDLKGAAQRLDEVLADPEIETTPTGKYRIAQSI